MVRPIEITDFLSKAQEVSRLQQNAEMRPDAMQEFQKALADKMKIQMVNSPNPTPQTDQVVLHIDEQEKEKRKTAEDQEHEPARQEEKDKEEQMKESKEDEGNPSGHIDIKA